MSRGRDFCRRVAGDDGKGIKRGLVICRFNVAPQACEKQILLRLSFETNLYGKISLTRRQPALPQPVQAYGFLEAARDNDPMGSAEQLFPRR